MNYNEFAEKVKTKYPDYADVDNKTLAEKMLQKYPAYKNQVTFDEEPPKPQPLVIQDKNEGISQQEIQDTIDDEVREITAQYGGYAGKPIEGSVEFNAQDEYKRIQKDKTLSKEQKIAEINRIGERERNLIDRENAKTMAKLYGGAALEIGSAAIPFGAGARAAGTAIKVLKPYLGKKIAQEVGTGLVSGALSGSVFGSGRGLMEDKNPLLTAAQDMLLGGITGGAIGGAVGKVGKTVAGKKLNKIENLKDLRKAEKNYYKNYIQETKVSRKDIGDIDFTQAGLETVSKQPQAGRNFTTLKNDIKNAKYLGEETLNHPRTDGIVKFHRLEKDGQHFLIGETKNGKKYYMSKIIDDSELRPSRVGSEPSINIIPDTVENFNPTISKSEDLKNITKKSVSDAKKEFKEEISKEFNENVNLNNSMTTNKSKNGFYKTVTDPVGYDMEKTSRDVNDILKEIKKNPEIVNDADKMADLENRLNNTLEKWTNTDFSNFAEEQANKYWNAIVEAEKFAKTSKNYSTLANRSLKTRGAVKTIEKKINSDVADAVTDREYLTRGLEVNKLQLEQMSPEEVQKLINSEDISDLSITARALDINKDIENGKIPLYKLNKWTSEGTPIGQAMQARSLLNLSTPQGALAKMVSVINEAAPKVVKNLKDSTKKIIENVNNAENVAEIEQSLQRTITNKGQRKTFAEKLLKLKDAGELNEESFTRLVDKHYKLPEITDVDLKKINELTSNLQNATGDYEQKVAEGLLNKYIADKVPKSLWDKVNSYRYQNMLLSGKSRIKDALLTGINTADTAIDESIASLIDAARSKITGGPRVISKLHPQEWFNGLKKGFTEGVNDVKLGISTGRSGERARYGLPSRYSFDFKPVADAQWESLTNNPIANALNNTLAGGERALNYSIRVPDRMFYEGRFASSLADQLEAAGLQKPTDEMIEQAAKEAREAVYQDDSWVNKLGLLVRKGLNMPSKAINNFTDKNFVPNIGDWVEPFVTTPANIANQGLKNTFGGVPAAIKLATNKNMLPEEIRDAEILLAKNVKGIAPILAGIAIGKGKIDSNIGNNNYAENEISGLKPQSIVIGDKAISLKDYPQMSIPMSFGKGVADGGFTQGLLNAAKATTDMSSLKSIGDLVNTVQSGRMNELSPTEILDNVIRNQGVNAASQLIPFSGAMGELRNDIDPYARELYTENTPQYILNRVQNRIPFASQALPVKYNAIGEPVMANNIENPVLRALSEGIDLGIRNNKKNDTYNAINQFADEIKDTDIKGRSTVGLQKAKRTIKVNGENVKLNNKQYSNYQKEYGKLNYLLKKQAINSERYKTASNEERAEYLAELRRSIEEAVKIKQFGHQPSRNKKKYTDEILEIYDKLLKE